MTGRLAGRRAVVTGGASGMGRATALRFAREGAEIVVVDRVQDDGDAAVAAIVADGGVARFARADVADEDDWAALAASLVAAPPDVLVHCAGIASAATGGPTDTNAYRHLMDVNALGTLLALRTGTELLRGRGGSIVAIGSVAGERTIASATLNVGYSASKAAVRSMVRSFAAAEGRNGIRVNCILPGFMPPMRGSRMPRGDEGESPYLPLIPLGRTGTAEDVASAALFLASDESAYITGAGLAVDGGFLV